MLRNDSRQRVRFLNITDGKVVEKTAKGIETYSSVDGSIEQICRKEREFNGEKVEYWYINLRDDSGELFSLGFPYHSGIFKSIILSLASDEALTSLSTIRIEPWYKDERTKVSVYDGEKRLNWVTNELPAVQVRNVYGQTIKDDSERMQFICNLVADIKNRIGI